MILIREEDRERAEKRKKRLLTTYIVIACLFVIASLLLLFLSPDGYKPYMAVTIVISAAFGCYSVFFFSVQYDLAKKTSRLLDKVLGALSECEYALYVKELGNMTYEGIEMRTIRLLILGSERDVHLYNQGDISLKEGVEYTVDIRAGVLYEIAEKGEKDEKALS